MEKDTQRVCDFCTGPCCSFYNLQAIKPEEILTILTKKNLKAPKGPDDSKWSQEDFKLVEPYFEQKEPKGPWALKKRDLEGHCIFFDYTLPTKNCTIYAYRPNICKDFKYPTCYKDMGGKELFEVKMAQEKYKESKKSKEPKGKKDSLATVTIKASEVLQGDIIKEGPSVDPNDPKDLFAGCVCPKCGKTPKKASKKLEAAKCAKSKCLACKVALVPAINHMPPDSEVTAMVTQGNQVHLQLSSSFDDLGFDSHHWVTLDANDDVKIESCCGSSEFTEEDMQTLTVANVVVSLHDLEDHLHEHKNLRSLVAKVAQVREKLLDSL